MNTEIHKEIIQAPHKFSSEETEELNVELRRQLSNIGQLEGQKKAAMQDFKLRIQNAENTVELLLVKLESGEEMRRVEAEVIFDPARGMKKFFRPSLSGESVTELGFPMDHHFIREEPMQPADWELPLFKKEEIENPSEKREEKNDQVGPDYPTYEDAEGEPTDLQGIGNDAAGATPIGDVLDQAAAATEAPKILIEHFRDGQWQPKALHTEFWIAAGKAGWTEAQRSTISSLLWENANGKEKLRSVDEMRKVLAPHVIGEEASNA